LRSRTRMFCLPHHKGLPHESLREQAHRLCYTAVVRCGGGALLCSGLQINFVPINFAQQGDGVYTNEASSCTARNSGHSPFTTRGLGAPHSMQRVYTALGVTRNSQPLRLGSSALRCATLQSSSAAARPTAVCVVVSVRACDAMQAVPCFGSWADSRRVSADTTEFTRAAQHAAPACIACNVQHARVLSA
jgi:hypothetical protein